MSDSDLRERFADLWVRLGGHGDVTPRLDSVLRSWQEPHRRYHGLDHLRDCLVRLDESPATGMERDLAEAALWYHDVIYRPGRRTTRRAAPSWPWPRWPRAVFRRRRR